MKTRCFDHIDLRVKDMEVAGKFYSKFLPQLGFVEKRPGKKYHMFYSAGGDKPSEFFGLTQDKDHKPNRTRIAFWADTRKEVDRLAKLVRKAGARRSGNL
jgi:catechol 2,3-dioxygenase-like lactoylglutathione lyase family enzyme